MGTRGQLATPSDSTVEGGPGLVLDNVLYWVSEVTPDSQLVHVDQLAELLCSVVVLDVLGGGNGGVQRSAVRVKLLSFLPS